MSARTWRERIAEARVRGHFSKEDRDDAGTWKRCAVGEHHEVLPLVIKYVPIGQYRVGPEDNALGCDGSDFYAAVWDQNFDAAESALARIEDRILVLKREFTPLPQTSEAECE